MPVASAPEFLNILEKSQLASPERLAKLRSVQDKFPDAKSLAVRLVKESMLTRWQAGALLAGNYKLAVGKYQLQNQLGAGRTGRVYLARHTEMGRQVAVKILPRRTDASATNLQQFMEQARAVSSLDHPNLIHTYDVDSEADQFYLVMEHFPGEDLQTVVDRDGPLDFSRAADIARQAAEGLAHAADKGMTHGDVRPSALAIDANGRVKVLHLGVVELAGPRMKILDEKDPATADYAAPEQTDGNATHLSDVYSLGCVFYFLLTGQAPFGEGTFADRRRAHQSIPPASVVSKRPETPPELAKLCQKMMAKTPANRPQAAKDVAATLAEWLQQNPLPATPKPAAAKEEKLRRAEPLPAVGETPGTAIEKPAPEAKASAAAMPSFDFGEPKKRTKTAAAAPAAAAAVAATTESAAIPVEAPQPRKSKKKGAAASGEKKPINKRLLIGLGAGGGVALLAIIGVAAMFLMAGDDAPEVAQADPAANTAAAANPAESDEETLDDETLDDETLDGDLFSSDDSRNEEMTDAAPDALADASATAAAAEESVASDAAPADPAPAESPPEPDQLAAANTEAQPPAPTAEAAADTADPAPAAEPAPTETAKSEIPPAEPAKADTPMPEASEKEAPPTEVAAAAPPAEKKPAPAKPAPPEPFADFKATAISLPSLEGAAAESEAMQPVSLGTVHDDPESGCFVRLMGGDNAHKGKEIFTLEADDPGFRNRSWTIFSGVGDSGEKDRVTLAKLSLDEKDQLMFQWTREGAKENVANFLRNCLLSIAIGNKSKEFALREPVVVEPLALSLEKAGARGQFDLDWAPEPEKVQVEIAALEGAMPKHTFDPQQTIKASGGKTRILFGDPPNQILMLEVRSTMTRKLGLSVAPFLNVNNQPVRFTAADLQRASLQAAAVYQQMNNVVTNKIGPEPQRKELELRLPHQQAVMQQYGELAQSIDAWKDSGKLQFRVFFTVGEHQVDLLKSGGAAAPPAPAEAPAPKN